MTAALRPIIGTAIAVIAAIGCPSAGAGPLPSTNVFVDEATSQPVLTGASWQPLSLHFTNYGQRDVTIRWHAVVPPGIELAPARGAAQAHPGEGVGVAARVRARQAVQAGFYDIAIDATLADGTAVSTASLPVRVTRAGSRARFGFVANYSNASVTPFDLRTHATGVPLFTDVSPGDVAVTPDGSRAFIANQHGNDVSVIDVAALRVVATIGVGKTPAGIRVSRDASTVWVTNYDDGTAMPIDEATLKTGKPIAVGTKPEEVAIARDGRTLYVADQGSNSVAFVDVQNGTMQAVPVGKSPFGLALDATHQRLYVSNEGDDTVTVVDTGTRSVIATVAAGKTPESIALSPDGSLLYVADSGSGTLTRIGTRTNATLPPIVMGDTCFGVAVSRDGSFVYVTCSGDDDLVTVDAASGRIIARSPTAAFPIAVGL